MASQQVIQYITLVFKPDLASGGSAPPASFNDACAKLKSVPGVVSVHGGPHHESPDRWTAFARWSSPEALDAFIASPEHTEWVAAVKALTVADQQPPLIVSVPVDGDVAGVLASPCVECFTAYGVEDGWLRDHMAPFAKAVVGGKLPGHHGFAYGQFEQPAEHGFGFPAGTAVRGLLGWDTVDAHLSQRGEGKLIDNNIHYVRTAQKQLSMFHVYLTQM
ncbi:hypothetical protein HJFPF1_01078 [Paramyrothecium foliicola]|nr:hypothetical protein HJFPF1_01078 [Paramyrothecium foliicola]